MQRSPTSVFVFEGCHLGLLLHFRFISVRTIGIDGLFREVVGAAAGCEV